MSTNSKFKKIWEKITEKWHIKLVCLILAIALYLLHQSALLEKRTFVVPLQVVQNGLVEMTGYNTTNVSVIVHAEKDVISQIKNSDLNASINLNTITESGTFEVPVNLYLSDSISGYDSLEITVKPEKLKVNVEKTAMKYVPVLASTVGEVGHGYVIEKVEIDPPYVAIQGPESIVNATEEIKTTRLNVSNAVVNFSSEVHPFETNSLLKLDDNGPYKATVYLTTESSQKTFDGIKIKVLNLRSELKLDGELPEISVTLAGSIPYLEKYVIPENFVIADLENIEYPGAYEIPLRFASNSNVQFESKSLESVVVNVSAVQKQNSDGQNSENIENENSENQAPTEDSLKNPENLEEKSENSGEQNIESQKSTENFENPAEKSENSQTETKTSDETE